MESPKRNISITNSNIADHKCSVEDTRRMYTVGAEKGWKIRGKKEVKMDLQERRKRSGPTERIGGERVEVNALTTDAPQGRIK